MIQTLFGSVEQEPTLLESLKSGVQKTRAGLVTALEDALQGKKEIDADLLDELEYTLITADIGVRTTDEILERIRQRVERHQLDDADGTARAHSRASCSKFCRPASALPAHVAEPPAVVMVVGVNGSGKDHHHRQAGQPLQGRAALRAAVRRRHVPRRGHRTIGDLGQRTASPVIRQGPGSDPSAVLFDALNAAHARKMDYVIVDTAGRLQTKENLMAELEKMRRTAKKVIPDAPHEVLLVLDATTGQNGLEQARKFTETSGVTGIVLTKLDGTAKGGIVVAIARELNLPIRYVGVGEKVDDLLPFDPEKFIESLFFE